MIARAFFLVTMTTVGLHAWIAASAQNSRAQESRTRGKSIVAASARAKTVPLFTPEREAAALTFVSRNHPELSDLLVQLRKDDVKQYRQAVGELFRVSERLADLRGRSPKLAELELADWRARSRIQLLAARARMNPNPEVIAQLREMLGEQVDLQVRRLERERAGYEAQVRKIDKLIEQNRKLKEQQVVKQLKRLVGEFLIPASAGAATGQQE
ncbi:MAG: hypothetical protein N2C14_25235 [Planctomycetales bacterium]